jgi:hypothetical protein
MSTGGTCILGAMYLCGDEGTDGGARWSWRWTAAKHRHYMALGDNRPSIGTRVHALYRYVEPLHAQFNFTLEGYADDEGLTRTVTHLIVRRVTRFLSGTCQENGCLLIHHGKQLNRLDSIWRLVVEHLRHLRWLFLCYQSGQSSTNSLSTGNSTRNSQRGHSFLLAIHLRTLLNMRWLLQLLGMYNCG